ncbi:MAG TPA: 3-isopropylmalate dehydratase small subunit [Dehalococcoidia bacterium]|nr:3-isopropylmalate dehydratase small subunit [Dehalococcoidia bacterium]
MKPFVKVTGLVAPLDRPNVDTDQICPAQFLKLIERAGFGKYLFHSWRLLPDGSPNPAFELNAPAYQGASVLVAGRNFGCGSSREHAVWALEDAGYRALIAPSFAEIFHKNCFENGVCPVLLPEEQVNQIMAKAKASPGYRLTVDLEKCEVSDEQGLRFPFVMHSDPETHQFRRYCLLNGLDEVGLTLQHEDKIEAYERRREAQGLAI